jgi:hypothetical protein
MAMREPRPMNDTDSTQGFSVDYPGLETVHQALLGSRASLAAANRDTQPGCTAAAEVYPAWSTSAVMHELRAKYGLKVTGYSLELADHANRLQLSIDNYRQADTASADAAEAIRIPGEA